MNKYYLYMFCALSLSGFMHQPTYSHSNACRKVLVKRVLLWSQRSQSWVQWHFILHSQCKGKCLSLTATQKIACDTYSLDKSSCPKFFQISNDLFLAISLLYSWKKQNSFPWLKCLSEASPTWLPAAVFQNCWSLSTYGPQNITLGKIPRLFAK